MPPPNPQPAAQTEHTPTPWAIFEHKDHSAILIGPLYKESYFTNGEVNHVVTMRSMSCRYPYSMSEQQKTDAAFICTAANSHALLVEALRVCAHALQPYDDYKPRDWITDRENLAKAHKTARALLASLSAPSPLPPG